MNHLNNLIIEGVTLVKPEVIERNPDTNEKAVIFSIENNRYTKNENGDVTKEALFFLVKSFGEIAEKILRVIQKDMPVRVVGRLAKLYSKDESRKDGTIGIICTHLEYQKGDKGFVAV